MSGFVLGGIFTHAVADAVAIVVATSGLSAGTFRYAATLLGAGKGEIDNMTAWGFFVGVFLAAVLLIVDAST